ncbi:MAG TPA: 3-phosphoserine/phosphohydroxythreonine transaminase [Phycisphaerales bacterium]|nr:3-phosphoserine/phosphohydroxythreonine transaminase [Phycisphaerales bacterium]
MTTFSPVPSIVNPAATAAKAAQRAFNFSAGPGVLPEEVIRQAQEDLWSIDGTGIGIMEHSHRGKTFDKVLAEAEEACRKVGNIPANYKVLFLTGGATTQNFMVPANLLPDDGVAAFLTTGYWAEKTFEESKVYSSRCYEAWDGRNVKHAYCPSDAEIRYGEKPVYVHMCSNNTIYGTQWRNADGSTRLPNVPDGVPLVCDMSSDIYSRPFDAGRFGLIYAGAQKNVGIAGTTVVIIRDDLLKPVRKLPLMLRYETHAKDQSRHNTPPAFAIYLSGLVFKWIQKQGGLAAMHQRNMEKAALIYNAIDGSRGFYTGHARPDSRSLMNITFKCPTPELDDKFVAEAFKAGMDQLKGHRSTGGVRASTYNAMPREGCKALADFMAEFARRNG